MEKEEGKYPDVRRAYIPKRCMNCKDPQCTKVCPTGATRQRTDGIVTMDYDRCIGCASCALACPYQARSLVHTQEWYYGEETVQEKAVAHRERLGVAQKCTFCAGRVDDGLAAGLTPGISPEASPACAASCISQAIIFGDFNDPGSEVSKLSASGHYFRMHEKLGNDPQIRYLVETPAVPDRAPTVHDRDDDAMSDPANPLVGPRQRFWDMRAAMNFILGGLGSGTVVIAYLTGLFTAMGNASLVTVFMLAGGIMALGLFFVWLKIGRKFRAPFVILRPNSSWMSREVYAVGVFYLTLAADWLQPHPFVHLLAAMGAGAFLYCQGRILHAGKGIPAWRVAQMPWMLVAAGLLEGAALLAIVFVRYDQTMPPPGLAAGWVIGLVLVNAFLWRRYLSNAPAWGIGPLDQAVLARTTPWLHGLGHVLPVVLFGAYLAWPAAPAWVVELGAILAIAGGFLWKAVVITRACRQQSFALGKYPYRGSG
ncbi:MAG: 4Fe-4S dicluster domain-containing protein, partial [Rhodospirillales bacterium]|nr:4Fe-4S dicluster domain-containing protein [Rhodospirillales bacterium]